MRGAAAISALAVWLTAVHFGTVKGTPAPTSQPGTCANPQVINVGDNAFSNAATGVTLDVSSTSCMFPDHQNIYQVRASQSCSVALSHRKFIAHTTPAHTYHCNAVTLTRPPTTHSRLM